MISIKVDNIHVPTSYSPPNSLHPAKPAKNLLFTLIVNKEHPSQEEIDQIAPGYRDKIRYFLNFLPVYHLLVQFLCVPEPGIWDNI